MLYITNVYGGEVFGTSALLITIVAIFSVIPKFGMDIGAALQGLKRVKEFVLFKLFYIIWYF
jgi:hypothetical protein